MSPHRSGGKFASSHTTIIEAAEDLVDAATRLPDVTKISLGEIKVIGRGMRNIKFLETAGGFKCIVRGNTSRQYIYIYSNEPVQTRHSLSAFEHKKG
jgi:siroheme synthase